MSKIIYSFSIKLFIIKCFSDINLPLKAPRQKVLKLNWKELLSNNQKEKGYSLLPVINKDPKD